VTDKQSILRTCKAIGTLVFLTYVVDMSCGLAFANDGDNLNPVILRFPEDGEAAQTLVPIKLFMPRVEFSENREDRVVLPRELRQRRLARPQSSPPPTMPLPLPYQRAAAGDKQGELDNLLDLASTLRESVSRDDVDEDVFANNQGWLARDIFRVRTQRDRRGEPIDGADILNQSLRNPLRVELEDISARGIPSSADRGLPRLSEDIDTLGTLRGIDDSLWEF